MALEAGGSSPLDHPPRCRSTSERTGPFKGSVRLIFRRWPRPARRRCRAAGTTVRRPSTICSSCRRLRSTWSSSSRSSVTIHVACTVPSTSTWPRPSRPGGYSAPRSRSKKRERSSCDSNALSYSGRNRIGAGVSGSGLGASGRSNSSRPAHVGERDEIGSQLFEHLGKTGQARPCRHVGRTRRAEGGEIAHSDITHVDIEVERSIEPCLGGRHGHLMRSSPHPARWHLHERQQVAAGERQRTPVEVGELLVQRRLELGLRARRRQILPCPRHRLREIDAAQQWCEVAMRAQLALQHRLRQRPEIEAVVCGEEMDRAADGGRPHDRPCLQQRIELTRFERRQPRPQGDVRIVGNLRLQPDEMRDRGERIERRRLEQQLARQRGSVELPVAEHLHGGRA